MKQHTEQADAVSILAKQIAQALKKQSVGCDTTFLSVIKHAHSNGTYTILDESGTERMIGSCIPGLDLRPGKYVWVRIPCGHLNAMHICGIKQ